MNNRKLPFSSPIYVIATFYRNIKPVRSFLAHLVLYV